MNQVMKCGNSLLFDSFESFYLILLWHRKRIEGEVFFDVNDDEERKNIKISELQNILYAFIREKNQQVIAENGKLAGVAFEEVVYIMVSLADELFLNIEWEGKPFWRKNLLEYRFFNTNCAGEKLFTNVESFFQGNADKDLGLVYLYAISLGFKGKFRYADEGEQYLLNLREQLFYSVYRKTPKLYKEGVQLFEGSENVFAEKVIRPDNQLRKVLRLGMIFAAIYLVVSHALWVYETRQTFAILGRSVSDRDFDKYRGPKRRSAHNRDPHCGLSRRARSEL